jgi:alkylhydroperoxidase family enzyme
MPHVPPLADAQASDPAKNLFRDIQSKFGMVPNIFRTMGHAPAILQATLALNGAIQHDLDPKLRELAYLKTSQLNGCNY